MATRADAGTETREEFEERLVRQSAAADAGEYDYIFAEMVEDLVNQLPDGYVLENGRIIRSDPNLPDHVYVESKVDGVPSGRQIKLVAF